MTTTFDVQTIAPEVAGPFRESGKLLAQSGLEPNLLQLIDLRASQINACAFCLALHTREAQALGESGDRLSGLAAWRDAPWYTARERAALEWTEALTRVAKSHPTSDLVKRVREQFSEREIIYLTLAIATINAWNRLAIASGQSPEGADAVFRMLHPQAVPAHG